MLDLIQLKMKTINLGTFATLINKKSEKSLAHAIRVILDREDSFVNWYNYIRYGVIKFFLNHCDIKILDALLHRLSIVKPSSAFQKKNCIISKEAVQLMKSTSYNVFQGKNFGLPDVKSITFHGIELKVNPNAIITWQDQNGATHVGAIKTKLKKSHLSLVEGTIIACMLQHYLTILYPDSIVESDFCICFDVFRRKFITSKNYMVNIAIAASIAERIASMGDVAA